MPKTNMEENLREVIGTYIIQLVQSQTIQNQQAELIQQLQAQLDTNKPAGPKLVVDNTKDTQRLTQPQPEPPSDSG